MEQTMESSYLIQRLLKPQIKDNPFTFGGGFKNGKLSDEGWNLIRNIFRFDYMGAAEYEFGTIPKALSKIYENREKYITFQFTCPYKYEDYKRVNKELKKIVNKGDVEIYVICEKDWKDEVQRRIELHATDPYNREIRCKIHPAIHRSLAVPDEWVDNQVGWLELDNGYFFFKDKDMFQQTCKLFEVKHE